MPVSDVVVLIPGIMGSVLKRNGDEIWAPTASSILSALRNLSERFDDLRLTEDPPNRHLLSDGVVADALVSDVHLVPGLWKIDGYSALEQRLQANLQLLPGANYFSFAYDWRRDCRVASRGLAEKTASWLDAWRTKTGKKDAKLIFICHSMGGLVARHFVEQRGGWKDTRVLLTLGTPYQGSLKALTFLVNGVGPWWMPGQGKLTDLCRSFTSVYQLLPTYHCIHRGGEDYVGLPEASALPNLDMTRVKEARVFHEEISAAVEANSKHTNYRESGYRLRAVVGFRQPTDVYARIVKGKIETEAEEGLLGGDGTVARGSAIPVELANNDGCFASQRHAALQNSDIVVDDILGVLTGIGAGLRGPGPHGLTLSIDDSYRLGAPVAVRAEATMGNARLVAVVRNVAGNAVQDSKPLERTQGPWLQTEFRSLPTGVYRVTVAAEGLAPVSDLFAVV